MARRTDPSCRLCRREGEKLFLKGTRCYTDRCAISRRGYAPGEHGQSRRGKLSNYAMQLREKQKAKRIYGMLERQFKNYFKKAERAKGATGEVLLQMLERRLDNVLYRACFASSRSGARQLVGHKLVKLNGRGVNIPSYLVRAGDEIAVSGREAQRKAIKETVKLLEDHSVPDWISRAPEGLVIKVIRTPNKRDIGMEIEESLIVELYSK